MYVLIQCNLLSLSLMVTLAVCNPTVIVVSKVVRVTRKDLLFSTTISSKMGMVTTWAWTEMLKVKLVDIAL